MDSSWAPQSPDLSHYYSAPAPAPESAVHPQHRGYRGSISHAHVPPPPFTPPTSSPTLHAKLPAPPAYMPRALHADYTPDASAAPPPPDPAENIVIKNHFPVARIKRIMQADDDVGKVAQVTPVVVSKALELFMISLVTKAAAEAKARNSKRVGAVHLKQAVTKNEQFDFLNEIVAKVADAPDKSEGDAMDVDGKKKKAPSRRKKKTDDDDDF